LHGPAPVTIQEFALPQKSQIREDDMLADGYAPLRYVASPPAQTGTNAPDFQTAVATAQAATGALSPHNGPQAIAPVYRDWANVEAIVAAQYRIAWSQPDPQKAVALLDQQYAGYLQHEGLSTRFFAGVVAFAKAQEEPASSPTLNADFHAADKALSAADLHAVLQYKFGRGHQGPYTAAQIQAAVADLNNLPAWKVAQTLNDPSFGTGSPESAANGAAAALDLLSTSNPYFYSHLLFQTDAGYSPTAAKAQAFLATLSAYEQKGDTANIAQLLNALGPDQAAQFFADAGTLTGPQYSQSGSIVANDQTHIDQVLSKALLAPGVQLGDPNQQGTLAYSLLQQATQSGSDALAIAGILNQSGTSPQAEALKQAFLGDIMVVGKAQGGPSPDQASYAQAAQSIINSDPALLRQLLGGPGSGSPESATNGADAAKDLLSSTNPYFYNSALFQPGRGYNPDHAKAQAFAATLYDYEQRGDNADIAQLLQTLGPAQAAKFFSEAGNLQGPQLNGIGITFAKDQTGVDQMLSKALLAPGVPLGDGTQQGTLAYSLLQQATQSGSDALSIAGILNQSGTSPQAEALKQAFLGQIEVAGKAVGNPNSADGAQYAKAAFTVINGDQTLLSQYDGQLSADGIFGSSSAGLPTDERTILNGIRFQIGANVYPGADQGNNDPTGFISQSTMYNIQQYLSGKMVNGDTGKVIGGNETPAQRLANLMSVLGPDRTYAMLTSMTPAQAKQLGIQNSLNTLTNNGQFTGDDAKALGLAQAHLATDEALYDFPGMGWVGSLINSLPNNPNGTAVKVGYAEGCIAGAQQLAQEIASGKYSGQTLNQLTATLNGLLENATGLSAGFSDPVKVKLFTELRADAGQLTGPGAATQRDVLNAYAADILGSLSDKSQVASILRAMGGVGADGAIDPNSALAQFLQSALRGQSQLGIASWFGNNMTPNGQMIKGVTSLLNAVAGSGDTTLMAGTLDTVMQWTIHNPTQAEVFAAQDTGDSATGYRNALTTLLNKSFDQFVALNPSNPNATIVRTMQPQTIADLQALSAVEMGPPYDSKIAGNFALIFGGHVAEYAQYAIDGTAPQALQNLLASGGDPRNSAAVIFGQLMNGFFAGLNQSQTSFQTQAKDAKAAADQALLEARVATDIFRGIGTTLLLGSAWLTGNVEVPAFLKLGETITKEKGLSIIGRIGLAGGSWGTFILDQFFSTTAASEQAKTEEQAVQAVEQGMQKADVKPTQILEDLYNGWFSSVSQLPGGEGQKITDGVMTGSSFSGAPAITTDVQNFYGAYNPMGYYQSQTGQYPATS
jgi:hypothetical protein